MKRIVSFCLVVSLLCGMLYCNVFADYGTKISAEDNFKIEMPEFKPSNESFSTYLIEATTGTVLYSDNQFASAEPASVTKIMTLLLVAEALEEGKIKLEDTVSISANAASKGGSQVFLKEGERISVLDLLKSTIIASANDAATALAELVCGSEASFVKKMNMKARELGLKNTNFENPTGLDDTTKNHYTCAADIGLMSKELIKHDIILKYSSVWQDSIRNGEFTLTNTNRLVRYYDGCNGLKTGSTDKAGFCISATAKRDGMQLIAVIMGAETKDIRNNIAREMLDFGFANFTLYRDFSGYLESTPVIRGKKSKVNIYSEGFETVLPKEVASIVEKSFVLPEAIVAPMKKGDKVGKIIYAVNGEQIGFSDIIIDEEIVEITYLDILGKMLKKIFIGN